MRPRRKVNFGFCFQNKQRWQFLVHELFQRAAQSHNLRLPEPTLYCCQMLHPTSHFQRFESSEGWLFTVEWTFSEITRFQTQKAKLCISSEPLLFIIAVVSPLLDCRSRPPERILQYSIIGWKLQLWHRSFSSPRIYQLCLHVGRHTTFVIILLLTYAADKGWSYCLPLCLSV